MKIILWHSSKVGEQPWQSQGPCLAKCSLPASFFFFFFSSCVRILAHFSVLEICKFSFLLFSFPNNSLLQIMLLTDPEIESSLLISSDEGATYQKYRLNFYLQSLLFHPKQEDWILAYSQDQKVSPITLWDDSSSFLREKATSSSCLHVFSMISFVLSSSLNRGPVGRGEARRIPGHLAGAV